MIAANPLAAGKNGRRDAPQIAAAIRLTAVGADGVGSSIAYVSQQPTLMPWATLIDHVRLPLRIAGVSGEAARARIEPVLASLDLSGLEDAYPAELSGGMRMRASIARALVIRPRVLLMDEPFAALDEITRARLNDDLIALWQAQGFTVLFVTHSVFEAVYGLPQPAGTGDERASLPADRRSRDRPPLSAPGGAAPVGGLYRRSRRRSW